jgi:hypothetical protein
MLGALLSHVAATCSKATVGPNQFCTDLPQPAASSDNVQIIVHIIVGIIAAVAVLIIVIAALNIVTAGGDSGKVAKARSAIIYALIGLAVAALADAIVSLIIGKL